MNNSVEAGVFDKLSQPLEGTGWKDRLRRFFQTKTQNQLEQEKIEDYLYKRII